MKTMSGEVVLKIPSEKAWRIYRDDQILSKINPKMLANASYLQGDGGAGSLRLFRLGPNAEVSSYVKESYQKIEKVEEGSKSVTYQVVGGDITSMYNPYRVTVSFTPVRGRESEMCVAGWKAEFTPLASSIPPPERAKDAALGFFKCFDQVQCC